MKERVLFSEVPIIPIIKFEEMIPEQVYVVVITCSDCGAELNRSKAMTGADIKKYWVTMSASAPLHTKPCPGGCRATASDCNANTDLTIREEA